jgi:hypothetical protein
MIDPKKLAKAHMVRLAEKPTEWSCEQLNCAEIKIQLCSNELINIFQIFKKFVILKIFAKYENQAFVFNKN